MLKTTPAASDAESYASVAEADAYLADNPYASGWSVASQARKEWALRSTGRLIDAVPGAWTGAASTAEQAMGWPRTGMLNRNGYAIASGEIPVALKNAQIEYARQMLDTDLTATNEITAKNITKIKAGPVELSFKENDEKYAALTQKETLTAAVPDAVRAMLVPSWLYDPRETEAAYTGFLFENLESDE